MRICVNRALVERMWRAKGGGAMPKNLMIAIRSMTPAPPGGDEIVELLRPPGYNNDTVGLVLGEKVRLYPGTTDAGRMSDIVGTKHDNRLGIFHLDDGLHKLRKHPHLRNNGKPPKGAGGTRAAWRVTTPPSDEIAEGWRDLDDSDTLTSGDTRRATSNAINVHWGAHLAAAGPGKTLVRTNSIGCLNVLVPYWVEFREAGYDCSPRSLTCSGTRPSSRSCGRSSAKMW
jgi:hypothetical protein